MHYTLSYSLITNHSGLINDISSIKITNNIKKNIDQGISSVLLILQTLSSLFRCDSSWSKLIPTTNNENTNNIPIWMFVPNNLERIRKLFTKMAEKGNPMAAMTKKNIQKKASLFGIRILATRFHILVPCDIYKKKGPLMQKQSL